MNEAQRVYDIRKKAGLRHFLPCVAIYFGHRILRVGAEFKAHAICDAREVDEATSLLLNGFERSIVAFINLEFFVNTMLHNLQSMQGTLQGKCNRVVSQSRDACTTVPQGRANTWDTG
uniref:Uncharacterized protein n=1 Tax=Chrysotila carterae TaxID=13221 RepID=A0A7S4AZS4_CHRCT